MEKLIVLYPKIMKNKKNCDLNLLYKYKTNKGLIIFFIKSIHLCLKTQKFFIVKK